MTIGTTRFSPGSSVKRTAMAAAMGSSLLVQESLELGRRPSLAKGVQTSLPSRPGSKVVR